MTDLDAAAQFVYANARVLDRHRLHLLLGEGGAGPVVDALRAYRNPDGGFGHGLEPDMRAPGSEPSATMHALEILVDVGAADDPMVADAAAWLATIAAADGTVPQLMETARGYPYAPFLSPGGPPFLTYALAGALWRADHRCDWLDRATAWCWSSLEGELDHAYTVVFALRFLDAAPDEARALRIIDTLRPQLDDTGSIPVEGGVEGERVTPLELSPHPKARSRTLFTDAQLRADLERVERGQQPDGGWDFDFLHWSPGQALDWRGSITVSTLRLLIDHGTLSR